MLVDDMMVVVVMVMGPNVMSTWCWWCMNMLMLRWRSQVGMVMQWWRDMVHSLVLMLPFVLVVLTFTFMFMISYPVLLWADIPHPHAILLHINDSDVVPASIRRNPPIRV